MRRDRGTKKVPNIGNHTQFSIMTTEANAIVEPIHEKAMPVMLMTPEDVEQWLKGGSVEDALKMQKPAPDDAIVIRPEEKQSGRAACANLLLPSIFSTIRYKEFKHVPPRRPQRPSSRPVTF
jgi:hypothetical protein